MKLRNLSIVVLFFVIMQYSSWAEDTWSSTIISSGTNNSGTAGKCITAMPNGDFIVAGLYKADEVIFDNIKVSAISSAAKLVEQDRKKIYLARISNGKFVWAKSFGSRSDDDNPIIRIANDKQGNIYVLGAASGTVTIDQVSIPKKSSKEFAAFLAKLDGDGNAVWGKSISAFNKVEETDLAVNDNGDIVVATSVTQNERKITQDKIVYNRPGSYSSAILIRFDTDGNALWIKGVVSEGAGSASIPKGVTMDKAGNAYLIGEFSGGRANFGGASLPLPAAITSSPAYGAVFLARYNVEGLCDMVANVGSNLAVSDPRPKMFTVSLSADEKEIYVTGSLSKNFTVWDQEGTKALANVQNKAKTTFFISKYDQQGNFKSIKTGETKNCYVEIAGFEATADGNFVFIGNFAGNMANIGDDKKYVSTTDKTLSRQKYFPFIIRYDSNWNVTDCNIIEANAETKIYDFCVSGNNICTVGEFAAEVANAKLGTLNLTMSKDYSKSFVWMFK